MEDKINYIEYCIQQIWHYIYELEDVVAQLQTTVENETEDE